MSFWTIGIYSEWAPRSQEPTIFLELVICNSILIGEPALKINHQLTISYGCHWTTSLTLKHFVFKAASTAFIICLSMIVPWALKNSFSFSDSMYYLLCLLTLSLPTIIKPIAILKYLHFLSGMAFKEEEAISSEFTALFETQKQRNLEL